MQVKSKQDQTFYVGVCEDNNDPLYLGRIRIRIVGLHTENKTDLPTEDLPWADPVMSPIGNISEVSSFTVPEKGSWIICAFYDPKLQRPFYLGTLPRIESTQPNYDSGFSDPDKKYPLKDSVKNKRSSISRIAIGRKEDAPDVITEEEPWDPLYPVGAHANKPAIKENVLFDEPASAYDTVYPNNKVIQTKSGHVIEIDDTPDAERIQIMHKSGSFMEFHPDGKIVVHSGTKRNTEKTNVDIYLVSDSNINIHSSGETNLYSGSDINIETGDNINVNVEANITVNSNAQIDITSEAETTIHATGNLNLNSAAKILLNGRRPRLK